MMIKDLFNFTPTRPLFCDNGLERYFNRRTFNTALQEQKYRRGMKDSHHSDITCTGNSIHSAGTFTTCANTTTTASVASNQDEYLKELEQRRMNRLNRYKHKYFPNHDTNNHDHEEVNSENHCGVRRKLDFEGVLFPIEMSSTVSSLTTITTTATENTSPIQDISNVRIENRSAAASDASLEDVSLSSFVHHVDENNEAIYYNQELDSLEIEASKTFDEDEEAIDHILELEIETAMAFDEEDEFPWPMDEEEGFPSSPSLESVTSSHDEMIFQHRYFTTSSQIY